MFDKLSEDQRQALNIVREGHNLFITGQGGTARKNNCLLLSIFFQQGRVALGKWITFIVLLLQLLIKVSFFIKS